MQFSKLSRSDETKVTLAKEVARRIKVAGLTQRSAASKLGWSKSKVTAISKADLSIEDLKGISLEKLLVCLERLDEQVTIKIGQGVTATEIYYETEKERYVRLNGDKRVPLKYRNGFTINLAPGWEVEISDDPEEWSSWKLPSSLRLEDDIITSADRRSVEDALKTLVYTNLTKFDPAWNGVAATAFSHSLDQLKREGRGEHIHTALEVARRAITAMHRDTQDHQKSLALLNKSESAFEPKQQLMTFKNSE